MDDEDVTVWDNGSGEVVEIDAATVFKRRPLWEYDWQPMPAGAYLKITDEGTYLMAPAEEDE